MTEQRQIIITVIDGNGDDSLSYMEIVRVNENGDESKVYMGHFNRDHLQYGSPVVMVKPGPNVPIIV